LLVILNGSVGLTVAAHYIAGCLDLTKSQASIADTGLRGIAQQRVEVVGASALAAIGDFLAPDAERRPGHRRQTLGADVLFTLDTYPELTLRDEAQRSADVPQQIGVPIQIADHQLALGGVLHFIESIGALFDGDAVAIA